MMMMMMTIQQDSRHQCAVYEEGGAEILIGPMGMIVLLGRIISMPQCCCRNDIVSCSFGSDIL